MNNEKLEVDRVLLPYFSDEDKPYSDDSSYLRHTGVELSDVKDAYRRAVKDLHPDQGGHGTAFKRATEARDFLENVIEEGVEYTLEPAVDEPYSGREQEDVSADYRAGDDWIEQMERKVEQMERETEQFLDILAGREADLIDRLANEDDPLEPEDVDIL